MQVGTVIEITTETIQGKNLSEIEIQVGIGVETDSHDHGLEWNQKVEEIVIDSRTESRSQSSSRVSTNRDRIRCYRCKEI